MRGLDDQALQQKGENFVVPWGEIGMEVLF
jgi:hypothetical protein